MFTAVIPMMLVMRQADTFHDMSKHELDILDQERDIESLYLYVCPEGESSPNVNLKIVNKGEIPIHVVNLWINDDTESVNIEIPSLSDKTLGPFDLDPMPNDEYDIRVTTDRGNVFPSENGILHYGMDKWEMETFSIRIFTSRFTWRLHIQIWIGTAPEPENDPFYDQSIRIGGGGYEVIVPNSGWYYVTITRKWRDPLFDEPVYIPWPTGDPYVWIFT